jgi:hypothetical protein
MTEARDFQNRLELRFASKNVQERMGCEVGIAKETRFDTAPKNAESKGFISEDSIGLGNFVSRFGIATPRSAILLFNACKVCSPSISLWIIEALRAFPIWVYSETSIA